MKNQLVGGVAFCLFLGLLTGCLKTREVPIPSETPPPLSGDTISRGALYINEVNNRSSEAVNLANELSPNLSKRFTLAETPDWKDGKTKWFEIFNNTNKDIVVGDPSKGYWYISDNLANKVSCPIETRVTIPAQGFAIVYGSDTNYTAGTQIHTCFGIGRNDNVVRDTLGIYYQKTLQDPIITIDSLTYETTSRSSTWSRIPNGGSVILSTPPTPGASNRQ
jgi:hypothetical protein